VAVAIYDPEVRVGGLLQFLLPDSRINQRKAMTNPFLFADTGIPLLFRRAYKLGAVKERIICRLVGGANVLEDAQPEAPLEMGRRNYQAALDVLTRNNVRVRSEYVGGLTGMTLTMYLESGRLKVLLPTGKELEI
jgi:chemotaxis protein CheD